ncbi:MAG: dephospho-CoA kinase [Cytophagaceae bacterium]|nr:dephospho-CoA kinase [Cytophagaceae bacterium]MDW8457189.1 dephospho-CoA kinase [Cytophagaceae bacterium]
MNKKRLIVGVTGGIGTGKTTVCKIFNILNVPVYDADSAAKRLMQSDRELIKTIQDTFGDLAYAEGKLNTSYLAERVFSNPQNTELLNRIVHPKVGKDFMLWLEQTTGNSYVIKEAALLFESGSYRQLDKIIAVTAPLNIRIERVLKRDPHRTKEQVLNIMDKQWKEEEKIKRSDFVIQNDESSFLIEQVLKIHEQLISLSHFML